MHRSRHVVLVDRFGQFIREHFAERCILKGQHELTCHNSAGELALTVVPFPISRLCRGKSEGTLSLCFFWLALFCWWCGVWVCVLYISIGKLLFSRDFFALSIF